MNPELKMTQPVQAVHPWSARFNWVLMWVLNAFATVQFIRYYVVSTHFYLKMPAYLSGHERLPFQERVLPIFLMWPINHCAFLMRAVADRHNSTFVVTAATTESVAFYLVSLVSFAVAGLYVVRLYRAVTPTGTLITLVYPAFLVVAMWTYVVHVDANYSYPYDMPALAFFTAGLYYIYMRRFVPLLVVMLLGTLNRETTLFLIGIYVIDEASTRVSNPAARLRERFSLRTIPWGRVAILSLIWLTIKLALAHHFAHNDASEDYIRIAENLRKMRPRLLPSLLNICGYLLPVVWILRHRLRPVRFANYIYIFPFWVAVMFVSGVMVETRIYGELSSFAAIAVVLLLEEHVQRAQGRTLRKLAEMRGESESDEVPDEALDQQSQAA